MWKGVADSKKVKCLSKEEIKQQLLESIITDEVVEFEDLNKEAEEIQDPEKAAEIIKRYEDIIKTKKKGIIRNYKEKEKFAKLVSELGIHKTTIIFKINVFKLCKEYPKLLKSSIDLGVFKDYYKDIKAICQENEEDFQYFLSVSIF